MKYRGAAENHVLPRMGHLRLDRILHAHAQAVIDAMADKGFEPTTTEGARTVMSASCAYAYIRSNPVRGVETPREGQRDARVISPADVGRLLRTIRGDPGLRDIYAAVHMLLNTGMRLGELLGLRREAIDL